MAQWESQECKIGSLWTKLLMTNSSKKKYMSYLQHVGKAFEKVQHTFLMKTLEEIGINRCFLTINKHTGLSCHKGSILPGRETREALTLRSKQSKQFRLDPCVWWRGCSRPHSRSVLFRSQPSAPWTYQASASAPDQAAKSSPWTISSLSQWGRALCPHCGDPLSSSLSSPTASGSLSYLDHI